MMNNNSNNNKIHFNDEEISLLDNMGIDKEKLSIMLPNLLIDLEETFKCLLPYDNSYISVITNEGNEYLLDAHNSLDYYMFDLNDEELYK